MLEKGRRCNSRASDAIDEDRGKETRNFDRWREYELCWVYVQGWVGSCLVRRDMRYAGSIRAWCGSPWPNRVLTEVLASGEASRRIGAGEGEVCQSDTAGWQ